MYAKNKSLELPPKAIILWGNILWYLLGIPIGILVYLFIDAIFIGMPISHFFHFLIEEASFLLWAILIPMIILFLTFYVVMRTELGKKIKEYELKGQRVILIGLAEGEGYKGALLLTPTKLIAELFVAKSEELKSTNKPIVIDIDEMKEVEKMKRSKYFIIPEDILKITTRDLKVYCFRVDQCDTWIRWINNLRHHARRSR